MLFSIILLFIDRSGFKIALRDIPLFLGLGLGSILGTVALRRYSPYTVTTYTFVFAGSENLPLLLGVCVLTALVTAYNSYNSCNHRFKRCNDSGLAGFNCFEAQRAYDSFTSFPVICSISSSRH